MKLWSAFYPDVLPELPGAADIVVSHWLRNTAIDFCERTRIQVVDLDAENGEAGIVEYDLAPPSAQTEIIEVLGVSYNGSMLEKQSVDYIEDRYGGNWREDTGTPCCYTQLSTDKLLIIPAPVENAESAIVAKVALRPSLSSSGLEDWIFSKYRLAIAAGAKSSMMLMGGGVPWANPDRAAIYATVYADAVTSAIGFARKSLVRAIPRFSGGFC